MKILILVIFLMFIGSSTFGFSESDSLKAKDEKVEKKIDDKAETSAKPQHKKKDIFIDKDGDGICDDRANGMSFEKFRKRHQYKKGIQNHGGKR